MRENLTRARELVRNGSVKANELLRDLTIAEEQIIELDIAGDAEDVTTVLSDVIRNVNDTLNLFQERVREIGQVDPKVS